MSKIDKTFLIVVLTILGLKFLDSAFTASMVGALGTWTEANPIVKYLLDKSFHLGNILPFVWAVAVLFGTSFYLDYLYKNNVLKDYWRLRRLAILVLTFVIFPIYVFINIGHIYGHIFILPALR